MWLSTRSGTRNALKLPTLDLAFHSSRVARASKSSRGEVMEAIRLSEGKAERVLRSSPKIMQIICLKCWGSRNVVSLRWRWQHLLAICEGNRYDFQYPAWLVFSHQLRRPEKGSILGTRWWENHPWAKSPPLQWVHLPSGYLTWKITIFNR